MRTTYPSRRDPWLVAVLVSTAALSAGAAVFLWMQPMAWEPRLIFTGLFFGQAMFILDLLLRTEYRLDATDLRIRCGLFRWRVPYESIVRVHPTRTLLSGPALSLDRLAVVCHTRLLPVIISPDDQGRFLKDLAGRQTDFVLTAEALIRQSAAT